MTRRESRAILAGPRTLQDEIERLGKEALPAWEVLTDVGEVTPLSIEEINDLWERLNSSSTEYKVED